MRKRSHVVIIFFLVVCFYILPTKANPRTKISSSGTISYPVIMYDNNGQMGENLVGDLKRWDEGWGKPIIDTTVVHTPGNPSLKVPKDATDGVSFNLFELNYEWLPVQPGDRVIFTAWVKLDDTSLNFNDGGFIGFDLYGTHERLWEVSDHVSGNDQNSLNSPKDWDYNYVEWGSGWTKLSVDFVIPDTTFYVDDYGDTRSSPQKVVGIIPWMNPEWRQLNGEYLHFSSEYAYPCPGDTWFADFELYILKEE